MTPRVVVLAMLLACGCGCGGAVPGAPVPTPAGVLVVRCPVADAVLVVDEQLVGAVGELPAGVRLRAGEHRVELRHDRFHTRYALVALAPGETRTLELTLAEALP